MLKHRNHLVILKRSDRKKTSEKWAKRAKNPENGGQNGHLGNKGVTREGQDRGAGLPTGQPAGQVGRSAGQVGGPAGPVVLGQFSRFSEAVSAFLRRKKPKSLRGKS